jgi:hypothetical protein
MNNLRTFRIHRAALAALLILAAVALVPQAHADAIQAGIERAHSVLAGGDTAIAAHLLDVPAGDIERAAGRRHDC